MPPPPTLLAVIAQEVERWSPLKVWLYSLFSRNPKSNIAAVELAMLSPEDRFLDIGCGPGKALEVAVATGATVAGIDPSPSMVARAHKRVPAAEVRVGSAEEIPYPDDSFSVVINVLSFHHWADRDAGLREAFRALSPGGRLHIVEGLLKNGKDGHGLSRSDAEVLSARLEEIGYVDTAIDMIKPGRRFRFIVTTGRKPGDHRGDQLTDG